MSSLCSPREVVAALKSFGLERYAACFEAHGYDSWDEVLAMGPEQVEKLLTTTGMASNHADRFRAAVARKACLELSASTCCTRDSAGGDVESNLPQPRSQVKAGSVHLHHVSAHVLAQEEKAAGANSREQQLLPRAHRQHHPRMVGSKSVGNGASSSSADAVPIVAAGRKARKLEPRGVSR